MSNLISILIALGLGLMTTGYTGYRLGNTYGSNARAYAKVIRELEATNAKLRIQRAEDEVAERIEQARLDQAFDEASAKLLKIGTCPASKEAAAILNAARKP